MNSQQCKILIAVQNKYQHNPCNLFDQYKIQPHPKELKAGMQIPVHQHS